MKLKKKNTSNKKIRTKSGVKIKWNKKMRDEIEK
jgi:hypothetical protein